MQVFSANDIYPKEQYVSVKLQQVKRNYRLRNHFGIRVTSLTPVVNCWNRGNKRKVWINHRFIVLKSLGIDCGSIKEMLKWRRFCRILKRLNVINVNSEYCVKHVNFLICLRFNHYKDVLFNTYDLRSSDVKKPQFRRQNSISYVLMVSIVFMCFSNDKMVQWQSLGYS